MTRNLDVPYKYRILYLPPVGAWQWIERRIGADARGHRPLMIVGNSVNAAPPSSTRCKHIWTPEARVQSSLNAYANSFLNQFSV